MISINDTIELSSRHQELILNKLCAQSPPADIKWSEIENLFNALIRELGGSTNTKRSGSRVCFKVKDTKIILHKPHPEPEMDKGAISSVKNFLFDIGVVYETPEI